MYQRQEVLVPLLVSLVVCVTFIFVYGVVMYFKFKKEEKG